MTERVRFPSPYELKSPPGAEGWRELYPYYLPLPGRAEGQRGEIGSGFATAQHWPTPFRAFRHDHGGVTPCKCLGQYNTRHLWCHRPTASTTASTTATST